MDTQKLEVLSTQNHIACAGKIANGANNGTVAGRFGDIILNDGRLNGGRFIIDAMSVKVLNITDFTLYAKFTGHLASDDSSFPEESPDAFLDITSITGNHVLGDLTMKGILQPVDFDVVVNVNGDVLTVTAKLVVERTKIRYEIPLV